MFSLRLKGFATTVVNSFSPQLSYETSNGIPFEQEFFYNSKLDIDMHQKFLAILFLNVKSAEMECFEHLRKMESK